jgi:hypothetical protein
MSAPVCIRTPVARRHSPRVLDAPCQMNVDWSKLIACNGAASAEQVPNAVEMLFCGSPEERQKAYWQIDNYVVVHGGLFESAPYAARLVVDRLKADPDKLNLEILDLLFELANGNAGGGLVEHGPLKGKPIQQHCRDTVAEVLPAIAAAQAGATGRERRTIQDLLEAYEDSPA